MPLGNASGGQPLAQVTNRRDVIGRRPAAAADDVDEAGGGELGQVPAGVRGKLVVLAEGVRQPGVRMAGT